MDRDDRVECFHGDRTTMFSTSLTAMALAGLMSAPTTLQSDWTTSYSTAQARSAKEGKPIAVFIAPTEKVEWLETATLSDDTAKTLKSEFISVKIDSSSVEGKKLSEQFGIQEGLVISDKKGELIALRHEGAVASTDLATYLTQNKDKGVVTTTEYRSSIVVYQQPRPILNAVQNAGVVMGNAVQRTGQIIISPLSGGS
jgi:hypothetical protein